MFERTVYTVTEGNPPDDVTVEVTLVATHECDDEYVVTIIASDVTADGEISTIHVRIRTYVQLYIYLSKHKCVYVNACIIRPW